MFFLQNSQYKKFYIAEDRESLNYKGTVYKFSDITHLYFSHSITRHSINLIETGKTEDVFLKIFLANGRSIKLAFTEIYKSKTRENLDNLISLYQFIAENTFNQRLQLYLCQVQKYGYFEYDECKFYPNDKIVFKNKSFPINSSSFLKGGGVIELRPKNWTIFDRIKRETTLTKIPQFCYETDSDVIFYILDKYFNLRWS